MTLVQCANALGITNPALSQWEQGKREPKYAMLFALCNLLNTTPNDLIGFSPSSLGAPAPPHEVKAGANSAVAIGSNAQASVSLGDAPACSRCPYKKRLAKIEKMLGK